MHDAFLGTRNVIMVSNLCHQVAVGFHCLSLAPSGGGLAAKLHCLSAGQHCHCFKGRSLCLRERQKHKYSLCKIRPGVSEVFPAQNKHQPACVTLYLKLTATVFCLKLSFEEQCLVFCPVQGTDPT